MTGVRQNHELIAQLLLSRSPRNHHLCSGDEGAVRNGPGTQRQRAGLSTDLTPCSCGLVTHLFHISNVNMKTLCLFFRGDTSQSGEKPRVLQNILRREENVVKPHSCHTAGRGNAVKRQFAIILPEMLSSAVKQTTFPSANGEKTQLCRHVGSELICDPHNHKSAVRRNQSGANRSWERRVL